MEKATPTSLEEAGEIILSLAMENKDLRERLQAAKDALNPFHIAWLNARSVFGEKNVTPAWLGALAAHWVSGEHYRNASAEFINATPPDTKGRE